jgi:hypothetical protein
MTARIDPRQPVLRVQPVVGVGCGVLVMLIPTLLALSACLILLLLR